MSDPSTPERLVFQGAVDGSAAVILPDGRIITAGDEYNRLHIYAPDAERPHATVQLDAALDARKNKEGEYREADIEDATLVGHRAFWIGSHGRNRKGKRRPTRSRLFATDHPPQGPPRFVGYTDQLLDDMLVADHWSPAARNHVFFDRVIKWLIRAAAPGVKKAPALAPKAEGISIEALGATPEGQLLVGLRNPTFDGKALIVTLSNPEEALFGQPCRFEDLHLVPLGGRGLRSMDWDAHTRHHLLLAGPPGRTEDFKAADGISPFALYRWQPGSAPTVLGPVPARTDCKPEAVAVDPRQRRALILEDQGTLRERLASTSADGGASKRMFEGWWYPLG
ncbi:MAG: DUF3616 domain-containing protein [Bradymonadia bacterium]